MYHRSYISVEQELEAFGRVTSDDIRRLLAQWPLWPMTVVSVGPTTDVRPNV
jgi:predicted Zn-dependent peptidase